MRIGGLLRDIPSCEPHQFVAGDTVQWTKSLSDYPASDGWALHYRIVGVTEEIADANISVMANVSGGWDVSISAAASSIDAGACRITGWVTSGDASERHTVYDGTITALADIASVSPGDLQTPNQKILAAIDARMAGRITADQESVQIDGTSLVRIPIEKLATLRGIYSARVWRDLNPDRSNPAHELRFVRAR